MLNMAAALCRLSYSILTKNHFQRTRFLVFPFTDRYSGIRCFSVNEHESKTFDDKVKKFLACTILISGIGYVLYKRKDDYRERFENLTAFVPTIHAKASNGSGSNRDKYNFIAEVVEKSAPSVVHIEMIDKRGRFEGLAYSNGTGFIVAEDGLILTNAHVVNKPKTTVKVRLHDGSTYTGVVEEIDVISDLATVRINKKNLPVMKLGSSGNLRPGEFVVAIGSPLTLSNTVTSGVVSSTNRQSKEIGLTHKEMDYIQTDASITFGNSGGPLVNLDGEAIGINAMKAAPGISFAIPIDYAKQFLEKAELRRKNKGLFDASESIARRRFMGITMLSLTPDLIHELQRRPDGLPHSLRHGVILIRVIAGSPAHLSGLRVGDVVTHLNGEPLMSATAIYQELEKTGPLKLVVVRKDEVLHVMVNPEEQ